MGLGSDDLVVNGEVIAVDNCSVSVTDTLEVIGKIEMDLGVIGVDKVLEVKQNGSIIIYDDLSGGLGSLLSMPTDAISATFLGGGKLLYGVDGDQDAATFLNQFSVQDLLDDGAVVFDGPASHIAKFEDLDAQMVLTLWPSLDI